MPNFRHIITQAYKEILLREPDPKGLEDWNSEMNSGMTEAQVREKFARSEEYAKNFPGEVIPPIPPSPGDGGMALRVEGNRFVRKDGPEVKFFGAISCCADADADSPGTLEYGWPLVTTAWIDLLAAHKLNFLHVRLGPMVSKAVDPDGEPREDVQAYALAPSGDKYDLLKWDESYWARLRGLIDYARAKGEYFQVDIADTWVAEHGLTPWRAGHNIQGYDDGGLEALQHTPSHHHETWIRKVVRECGRFENVLWQDGNESFKGTTETWLSGMLAIVRDEETKNGYPHRPFGTNAQDPSLEALVDYGVWHEKQNPPPASFPRLTNEYDDISPEAVLTQTRRAAQTQGVSWIYWRGGHSGADFLSTLNAYGRIADGTDVPAPIPDSCPPLVRWGSKIFNIMNSAFQPVDSPEVGGFVVVDSTPRFGSGRGVPCNAEHPENCGGRECEDPRGGLWTLEEGSGNLHLQSDNFQCRVGPLSHGHYKLRVKPRPDCQDHYGKPVTVTASGAEGTTTEWDV